MSNIKKSCTIVLACTAGCFLSSTNADILFFLLDEGEQGAWEAALLEHRYEVYESLNVTDEFGDPGILAIDGPVFIGNIGIDSSDTPYGTGGRDGCGAGCTGLRLIGASQGFGNQETALMAGTRNDRSEDIFTVGHFLTAVELSPVVLFDPPSAVITVYDPNENPIAQLLDFFAPMEGRRLGILATDGDLIGRVNIYDDTTYRVEGFMGSFTAYVERPAVAAELTDFEIKTGVLLQGDINDLKETDNVYVHARSGFGQQLSELHLMEIVINAHTNESVRQALNLAIESRISDSGGIAKVRLKNWRTGEFDPIGQYSIGLNEETITFEDIDATDYVRTSGAIEISIKHVVFVPFLAFTFDSFFDLVEITVE